MNEEISVFEISKGVELKAVYEGLAITGFNIEKLAKCSPASSKASQFIKSLPSLMSDGVFTEIENSLFASIEQLIDLQEREFDPLSNIFEWSIFGLRIEATGTIGFDDFKMNPKFYLGNRTIPLKVLGVIAWRGTSIFRLPANHALALKVINEFNSRSADGKLKVHALEVLYLLKELSKNSVDLQFDDYLDSENVVKPSIINVGIQDNGKSAVLFPIIDGVSESELKKQFLNMSEVQDVYDLGTGSNETTRVIISPNIKSVLKKIKTNGFGVTGTERDRILRNPRTVLPEGEEEHPEVLSLVGFGPRVKGIGFPTFVRPVSSTSKESWFDDSKKNKPDDSVQNTIKPFALECGFANGESKIIEFDTIEGANQVLANLRAAIASGQDSIEFNDISIPVSSILADALGEKLSLTSEDRKIGKSASDKLNKKRILIHTNESETDYSEELAVPKEQHFFIKPQSFRSDKSLKDHQIEGIRWMQGLLARDLSKGALLADDMGLGKTLQILAFVAWAIEKELKASVGKDVGPYEPVLIVAPLMLLENWKAEIEEYFDESIFHPLEILHGSEIKKYRRKSVEGREDDPTNETLDIGRLRENRVIITNYDTVKNYQYSFAKVPWSIVAVDEAQEIKESSTATTYALKALNPQFRIASTGTPVETSLTNLWSILDFAHPGNRLGSLKEFNSHFGSFNHNDPRLGDELRSLVGFNTDSGLILRRAKADVLKDLKPKNVIIKTCQMDERTREKYFDIVNSVNKSKHEKLAALSGLQQLAQISQHPYLIEGQPYRDNYQEYLDASSKLRELINILREVKSKGEKALVFTRSRKMQDILLATISGEFDIEVSIVNGETSSNHKYVGTNRIGTIKKFSEKDGFNVLILSPEVAGVGLTITAANHVIHYGRWWNPAKENQATDRAHRMGQEKPVFVYYLILEDAESGIETFDQKLDRRLSEREELADNFLIPAGDGSEIKESLIGSIFSDVESPHKIYKKRKESSELKVEELNWFEFECLAAILLKPRFNSIFVTPRTGDRGVDVVGMSEKEILLVQCKKTESKAACQTKVIGELIDGQDYYREHILPKSKPNRPVKLVIVTNGYFENAFIREAASKDIELLDGKAIAALLSNINITYADVRITEALRTSNMMDLEKKIRLNEDINEKNSFKKV